MALIEICETFCICELYSGAIACSFGQYQVEDVDYTTISQSNDELRDAVNTAVAEAYVDYARADVSAANIVDSLSTQLEAFRYGECPGICPLYYWPCLLYTSTQHNQTTYLTTNYNINHIHFLTQLYLSLIHI